MNRFESLIDLTTFATVRRYLLAAHSPITAVLFVKHRRLLPRVAALLAGDDGQGLETRRRQLERWFASAELRLGGHTDNAFLANLDAISDAAGCEVLFLPPVYLVCLRGCNVPSFQKLAA
jgi:hypothetical protein